jgi:hypothetical protein
MSSSVQQTTTFRRVAQCFNHLHYSVPLNYLITRAQERYTSACQAFVMPNDLVRCLEVMRVVSGHARGEITCAGEQCIMRRFVVCILHQMLLK